MVHFIGVDGVFGRLNTPPPLMTRVVLGRAVVLVLRALVRILVELLPEIADISRERASSGLLSDRSFIAFENESLEAFERGVENERGVFRGVGFLRGALSRSFTLNSFGDGSGDSPTVGNPFKSEWTELFKPQLS